MDKPYKCPSCNLSFARRQQLRRHVKLRRHVQSHAMNQAKSQCQYCGDQFERSELLDKHINVCHDHEAHSRMDTSPPSASPRPSASFPGNAGKFAPAPAFSANYTFSYPRPSSTKILRTWDITCYPNPMGLPLDGPIGGTAESMDEWLDCFWPGYIGSLLKPASAPQKQDAKQKPIKKEPDEVDAWDLAERLAAAGRRKVKEPTSSSSDYGSPNSAHSRASSWSGPSNIPGAAPEVMQFPFGYPTYQV